MNWKPIFAAVAALALATMACGININLPITDVKTGPTVTDEINVVGPEDPDQTADVTLNFGAGVLRLSPGAEEGLISGTATYNVEDLKPVVKVSGNDIRIETGNLDIRGIPSFGAEFENEWELKLGEAPMNLRIGAGGYQGRFELGGLALQSLRIDDGAADVDLNFSTPNPVEMDEFRYQTGASNVELDGLANANFDELVFKSGAGSYTLDFSGELKRDATVNIDTGFSQVRVIVPEGVPARVFVDSGLSNVDLSGQWGRSGNDYSQAGEGPSLTINVNTGAGELELRN
jgi:hypothetical protein